MEYLFYSDFGAFEPLLGPKNAFSTHLRKFLDQMVMLIAFALKFPIISAISRLITRSTVRVLAIILYFDDNLIYSEQTDGMYSATMHTMSKHSRWSTRNKLSSTILSVIFAKKACCKKIKDSSIRRMF